MMKRKSSDRRIITSCTLFVNTRFIRQEFVQAHSDLDLVPKKAIICTSVPRLEEKGNLHQVSLLLHDNFLHLDIWCTLPSVKIDYVAYRLSCSLYFAH